LARSWRRHRHARGGASRRAFDWLSLALVLLGISLPSFISAALLLSIFAGKLGGSRSAGGDRCAT
jgi:ABC-type dipeptide/oligopeptide/nickel transport system permease component